MFGIGMPELVIILVLALIIFGPGKLPDVGKAVGRSINEFKKASKDITDEVTGNGTTTTAASDKEEDKKA